MKRGGGLISSDVMRGFHDLLILSLLAEGDSYAYEIGKEIKLRAAELYQLKETTLYSAFSRLEKNGWISSYDTQETHGRKRVNYTITSDGRKEFKRRKEEWSLITNLMTQFI